MDAFPALDTWEVRGAGRQHVGHWTGYVLGFFLGFKDKGRQGPKAFVSCSIVILNHGLLVSPFCLGF